MYDNKRKLKLFSIVIGNDSPMSDTLLVNVLAHSAIEAAQAVNEGKSEYIKTINLVGAVDIDASKR